MEKRSFRLVKLNMKAILLANIINNNFSKFFYSSIFVNQTGLSIYVKKEMLENVFFLLKKSGFFGFKSLVDIFGIDLLGRSENNNLRFRIYYIFYNRIFGLTLSLKLDLSSKDVLVSAYNIFRSAGWLEREIYDMFGVFFYKNPDMRRILTDYGFEGYPLRKDFPLTGFYEVQYSEEEKIVVSQVTKVNQALRLFHFSSVWDIIKK
jgi:NADH:ubiquinone oxidoreductase subunit C